MFKAKFLFGKMLHSNVTVSVQKSAKQVYIFYDWLTAHVPFISDTNKNKLTIQQFACNTIDYDCICLFIIFLAWVIYEILYTTIVECECRYRLFRVETRDGCVVTKVTGQWEIFRPPHSWICWDKKSTYVMYFVLRPQFHYIFMLHFRWKILCLTK